MTDATADGPDAAAEADDAAPAARGRRRWLLVLVLCIVAGGAGFAPTWLGLWSPFALIEGVTAPGEEGAARPPVFVEVPPLVLSIPGPHPRRVRLGITLEMQERNRAAVTHLLPRVTDVATGFLTGIAPEAYDRRGILEVIRAELTTRISQALGPGKVDDVLLTEFVFE